MTDDTENLLKSILDGMDSIDHIKVSDIPDIGLYMDQVTTLMDSRLRSTLRDPEEENKVLTKTMINNYAKNDLLPPPEKKKYSRDHVLLLIFIYYFKSVLSINDIRTLLDPITERYFNREDGLNLQKIYEEIFQMGENEIQEIKADVEKKYTVASEMFSDASPEDKDSLQKFSFICLLSYDVYVKKMLIEKMVDEMDGSKEDKKDKKNKQ